MKTASPLHSRSLSHRRKPVLPPCEALESRVLLSAAEPAPSPLLQTDLPAPVVRSPGALTPAGSTLTTLTPTFEWNPVTTVVGLTGYQLNIYDSTRNILSAYQVSGTATHYTLSTALAAGDQFVWNLRIVVGTHIGMPSAYHFFHTAAPAPLPAPVIVSPGSSVSPGPMITTLTPVLHWNAPAATGITGYQVNLYDFTAAKALSYHVDGGATSLQLPPDALTFGHKYVWNVRALAGTRVGEPSGYAFFQTPPAPVLPRPTAIGPGTTLSPGTLLTTFTPTLHWTAVPLTAGMTGYQINLYDATQRTFQSFRTTESSYTLGAGTLLAGDVYVWNVRIVIGTTTGPESNYLYFTAPPAAV